jgi:hypothetical protein
VASRPIAITATLAAASIAAGCGGSGGSPKVEAGVAKVTSLCREAEERFVDITNRDLPTGHSGDLAAALARAAAESASVDATTASLVRAVPMTATDRSVLQTALVHLAHSEAALRHLRTELHTSATSSNALLARFLAADGGCLAPGQEVSG